MTMETRFCTFTTARLGSVPGLEIDLDGCFAGQLVASGRHVTHVLHAVDRSLERNQHRIDQHLGGYGALDKRWLPPPSAGAISGNCDSGNVLIASPPVQEPWDDQRDPQLPLLPVRCRIFVNIVLS